MGQIKLPFLALSILYLFRVMMARTSETMTARKIPRLRMGVKIRRHWFSSEFWKLLLPYMNKIVVKISLMGLAQIMSF